MKLWRWSPVTGYWKYVRSVTPESAKGWLMVYAQDQPGVAFKLAKTKPRAAPPIPSGQSGLSPNPAKRKPGPKFKGTTRIGRASQATGKPPTKRLKARRARNRTPGVFPNPMGTLSGSAFKPYAKVDTRDGGFEYGMDAVTPVRFILGRARVLPKGRYVWWLPDEPAVHEFVKQKQFIGSLNELKTAVRPDWKGTVYSSKLRNNPAPAKRVLLYTVQHASVNPRAIRKAATQWKTIATFADKAKAFEYARAYANAHAGTVRVID